METAYTIKRRKNQKTPEEFFMPYVDVKFQMRDSYIINGWFIQGKSNNVIILFHNLNGNREKFLCLAKNFYELGWSIYMCDLRGHGDNRKTNSNIFYKIFLDGEEIIKKIYKDYMNMQGAIILMGFSLGASVAAFNMKCKEISGVILDSGPAMDIYKAYHRMAMRNKEKHAFCQIIRSVWLKWYYGSRTRDINKIKDNLKRMNNPILFIHGQKDEFISWKETKKAYDMVPEGKKQYLLIENAHHLTTMFSDSKRYYETIGAFLQSY